MATHTIVINDRNNKTKYLLGLITEMSKTEKYIEVDPAPKPNKTTLKAIKDVENGRVYGIGAKHDSRTDILQSIEKGLGEVKDIMAGKIKARTLREVLSHE